MLILDEPTNHLDIDAIAWLEERLARTAAALVLVTHDRHVLDRVTTRILELDRGTGHVHEGGYDSYLEARAEREERAASAESVRRNLARASSPGCGAGRPARTRKPKARIDVGDGHRRGGRAAARPPTCRRAATDGEPGYTAAPRALRHAPPRRQGGRAARRRAPLRRRPVALPQRRAARSTPGERLGHRRPERRRQVDAARRSWPGAHRARRGHGRDGTDRRGSATTTSVGPSSTRRSGCATRSPGRTGCPTARDARLLEQFWFDADAQCAPIGLLSGGERRRLQLLLTLAGQAQRAAARRADQRPRPRHAPGARGLPRRLARRARWSSATTGRSSSAPSPTSW